MDRDGFGGERRTGYRHNLCGEVEGRGDRAETHRTHAKLVGDLRLDHTRTRSIANRRAEILKSCHGSDLL